MGLMVASHKLNVPAIGTFSHCFVGSRWLLIGNNAMGLLLGDEGMAQHGASIFFQFTIPRFTTKATANMYQTIQQRAGWHGNLVGNCGVIESCAHTQKRRGEDATTYRGRRTAPRCTTTHTSKMILAGMVTLGAVLV